MTYKNNQNIKIYKEDSKGKIIFRIIGLVTVSTILLCTFIILSSMFITYFNNMTGKIVYLVELSILLSNFIAGMLAKNLKESFLSGCLFALIFYLLIMFLAGEISLSISMIYLFGIIIIASILGYLVKLYLKEGKE